MHNISVTLLDDMVGRARLDGCRHAIEPISQPPSSESKRCFGTLRVPLDLSARV
jgi:hypothetical protein